MTSPAAEEDQPSDESLTPHLPNHDLIDILCKLPIKTLMAVKCVRKSWLNLLSADTHFAGLHHRRSKPEILLRSSTHGNISTNLYLGTLRIQNNALSDFKLNLKFNLIDFNVGGVFANSCDGFLCFRKGSNSCGDSSYAVICNPVTGEFINVPPGAESDDMRDDGTTGQLRCTYGLGFSRKENRYKLLRMTTNWSTKVLKLVVEICTLEKGSSWRNLGIFPIYPIIFSFPYVFLEGKLHLQCPPEREEYIDCFDFDDEQFGKVPLPLPADCDSDSDRKSNCIRELGGCLSVTRFGSGRCVEIWVMKEYGVNDSWMKAFCVENHCFSGLPRPFMYPGNGLTLIFQYGFTLVLYNSVTDTITSLGSGYNPSEVIAYAPTLIPLKDALAGYEACVQKGNSRSADPGVIPWWGPPSGC